jgi:glycosyl transferase family 25
MNSSPSIFVISLPQFAQRYRYIRKHVETRLGVGYEVVGVYGAETNEGLVSDHQLSKGQIGCALSHLAVYKIMLERNLPHALVIEDDVILPKNIAQLVADIRPHISSGDVVQLHNTTDDKIELSTQMATPIQNRLLCYPMDISYLGATSAYLIGNDAARGILSVNSPVKMVADHWDFFFDHGAFETARVLHPSPIRIKAFETTIWENPSRGSAARLKRMLRGTIFRHLLSIRRSMHINRRREVTLSSHRSPLPLSKASASVPT